jgi:hypothetical protein
VVRVAEAVQHAGLAAAVAKLPERGQRLLAAVEATPVVNLVYLVRSRIVEMTGRAQELVTGMTASLISRNWCCGRPHRGYSAQSGVFNACMSWRGGGTACTGRRWFYSLVVRFFF